MKLNLEFRKVPEKNSETADALMFMVKNKNIAKKCKEVYIDKHTRHKSWCKNEPRTSDHAPVVAIVDKEKP